MVLVFSASSNGSAQVRREVERAAHKDVRILPFRIEDVPPSKSLEYFLSTQHWLDAFPGPLEPHFTRLCTHLGAILGEPTQKYVPSRDLSQSPVKIAAGELKHVEGVLAGFCGSDRTSAGQAAPRSVRCRLRNSCGYFPANWRTTQTVAVSASCAGRQDDPLT